MNNKIKNIIITIIIIIVGFLVFRDIFLNEGFLVKSDNPIHMLEAKYLADEIIPKYRWINGWYHFEYAGMPTQMYSYQLGIWLVVLIYYTGFHIFSAYKLALFIAAISIPLTLFFVLKNRFGTYPSFFASVLFLFQRDYIKLFLAGMWGHALGISLMIILLHLLVKYSKNINLRNSCILSVVLTLVILAHPFVTISASYLIILSMLLVIIKFKDYKPMLFYGLIFALSIGMSWFYLYPYFDTIGWFLTKYGWSLGNNIFEILYKLVGIFFSLKPHTIFFNSLSDGNYLEALKLFIKSIYSNLPMLIADLFFIYGLFTYFKHKDHNKSFLDLSFLFIVISLILGTGFWFFFPFGREIPFFGAALSYRFVYYAKIGLLIFSCHGMKTFLGLKYFNKKFIIYKKYILYFLITIISIGLIFGAYSAPKPYTETSGTTPIFEESLELWKWMNTTLAGDYRIFNQNTFGNINEPLVTFDSIISGMSAYYTNLNFIGSWYTTVFPLENEFKTEEGNIFGTKINELDEEEFKKKLETYNTKYIVAITNELKNKLEEFKILKKVYKSKNYEVYEYFEYEPEWISHNKNISYEIKKLGSQEIIININNKHPENFIIVKIAEHPYWKARINKQEIEIEPDENKMMKLKIPQGEYNITLRYEPRKFKHIIFSFAALIILLALLMKGKNL